MKQKKNQATPVTEGWKLYRLLQSMKITGPVSYTARLQVSLPALVKQKRKNSFRRDTSLEYRYKAYRFSG